MEHIGIDLGASRSSICRLSSDGDIIHQCEVKTLDLERLLAKWPAGSRVVIESCAESRKVARMAQERHEVCVVPTSMVRALGVGARGIKTDKRDAQNLAEASHRLGEKLPHVHVRSDEAAAIQDLVRGRASLIVMRTSSINFVRSQMRRELQPRVRSTPESFTRRVREAWGDAMMITTTAHLEIIDRLNEQIASVEKQMAACAKTEPATRLQKIAGVGPIVALAFLSTVDDPKRFASAAHLASYVGLSPGESTTGGRVRRTGLIAAGQQQLRALLVQAAHSMLNARRTREPMAAWAHELILRRGRKLGTCALARRLAIVMWAMLRDGTAYQPTMTKPRTPRPPARPGNDISPNAAELIHALAQEGTTMT